MTNAGSCLACDTIAGKISPPGGVIYQNEHWLVDHAVSPAPLRGFLIVKSKRHVEDIADLTLAEAALQNMTELQKPEILRALLTSQAEAITQVQTERKKAQEFIKNY